MKQVISSNVLVIKVRADDTSI